MARTALVFGERCARLTLLSSHHYVIFRGRLLHLGLLDGEVCCAMSSTMMPIGDDVLRRLSAPACTLLTSAIRFYKLL
jgi:hypothetical protein